MKKLLFIAAIALTACDNFLQPAPDQSVTQDLAKKARNKEITDSEEVILSRIKVSMDSLHGCK